MIETIVTTRDEMEEGDDVSFAYLTETTQFRERVCMVSKSVIFGSSPKRKQHRHPLAVRFILLAQGAE